ncbi:FAST kinase domain-containing protein 2, mitochondrial isoform X2 [Mustelus asterias]
MNIHPAGNLLLRNLRLCNVLSRRCALTGFRSCAAHIQTHGFAPLKRQNGSPYCLGKHFDWTTTRFHFSEKTEQRIPSAVFGNEAENGDVHSREISGDSAPSNGRSSNGPIARNGSPSAEVFITERSTERDKSLDQFFDRLQRCTSPSDVLDLYVESAATRRPISSCLMTMWRTTKRMAEDQKRYERKLMFEHPGFETICQQAVKGAQSMSCNDLAYSLFALVKIRVSQHSRLVHTLLRVTQERLNEFDERALSVLSSCLKNLDDSKSVGALRTGLRLLVEIRVPQIRTVIALQTMMRCIGKDAPLPLKKKLESKALSLLKEFTLPNSQYMFVTLAAMGHRSHSLLEACSNRVIENIHGVPFWRLVHVLQSSKDLQYRNPALLSAIGDHVASTPAIWQVKQFILFLVLFADLSFRHAKLMDTFAQIMPAHSESLTLKDVLSVLRVYALLNHQPATSGKEQFLQTLSDVFEMYLSKCSSLELLHGIYSFCLLGHYPQAALSQLFQEDILSELQSKDFEVAVDQERRNVVPFPQGDAIGSDTNIQRVAVLCTPVSAFCLGTRHPKERLALKMRHLEALGYHVALVSEQEFGKLSEDERVGFLKGAIFAG